MISLVAQAQFALAFYGMLGCGVFTLRKINKIRNMSPHTGGL